MGRTVWQHGGTIWGGYNSFMLYDRASGAVICVLINQLPGQAMQVAIQLLSILINNPVGIRENKADEADFVVYPNPTNGLVHIELPNQRLQSIEIFNPSGQLLKETLENHFSISDLPNGMYFLYARTEKGRYVYKLIKQ
jgi:hypothetical protein